VNIFVDMLVQLLAIYAAIDVVVLGIDSGDEAEQLAAHVRKDDDDSEIDVLEKQIRSLVEVYSLAPFIE
jgi:hypothetical protein